MPMARAVRLCPDLLVVPPNFAAYRAASQQVVERLHRLSGLGSPPRQLTLWDVPLHRHRSSLRASSG